MPSTKEYKTFFTIAAIWNLGAAVLFVGMALFSHQLLRLFLNIIPESFLWFYLFMSLVATFGLGYYWTGQDVAMNRDIIKMGIIGKLLVFILATGGWLTGVITILTAGAGTVDLLFAILFIRILLKI
jgi:hypothetical protein